MAKKAILEVLENTIGRYVLNLDAESLNVAIWSGKIELQSLQLDIAAVNSELAQRAHDAPNLASPFRVTEGRFDKVQLDVPWTNLSSKPVIFRAKGLYVWMEPHDFLKDDTYGKGPVPPGNRGGEGKESSPKKNQSKAEKERMDSIARAETARKSANAVRMAWEEKVDYSIDGDSIAQESSSSQNSSFLSRLVRRIIENLQLEIEDVHLAVRGCECAAGVVLRSLFLATTDAKGNRTFVDRQANPNDSASSFLHKELSISGLGIYLQKGEEAETNGKKEYLLSPLSFQATLRQSDLDQCLDFPKYLVHSKLQSLNITLSRTQLELGNRLALVVAPNTKPRPLFPEYRPLGTVSGNAKQWWRYAVRCIGRLNRRRSWVEFLTAFHKRKVYLELYKRHTCSEKAAWLKRLNDSELLELKKIESDRSISIAGLMLWRSIADAQVTKEREKQKHAESNKQHDTSKGDPSAKKKSVLSSIFGGAQRKDTSDSMPSKLDNEDATPIMLTVDEMKELEELALEHADHVLTKDSIYCDINFVLGSFQVNLTTSLHEPITSLEMGMVSTTFKANADGSFKFGLSLLSLEISDNVTSGTFYPTICRGINRTNLKTAHAFQFELKKSEKGDQELTLKMVAFEIIASPSLVFAVKEFFDVSDANMSSPSNLQLDVNASSLINGSVSTIDDNVSDTFSSAIMDAWNGKNKKKQMWTMDCDVSAPILILPENCTDPSATVLICNFGRFNFKYDTEALSPAVLKWFEAHQRPDNLDSDVDHVKLEMSDLSFIISSVGEATKKGIGGLNLDVSNSVIQPVSFALDIGIEHASPSLEDSPRMCAIGVLPAIILRLEPSHVEKVLRVAAQWTSNLHNLKGDTPATEEDEILKTLPKSFEPKSLSSGTSLSNSQADTSSMEYMHISVSLLRLSINIYSDKGDGLEVHLVSLVASSSLDTDGSSSNRVRMGWFWILDRLEPDSKFPRCQRLLFHSKLPRPAIDYAKNDQYDAIMEDLAKQGAFKPNYTGSTDLADINILQLPATKAVKYHSQVKEFPREYIQAIQVDHATVIDAKFTSIFINWNPKSVASFFEAKAKLLEFKDTASLTYEQITTLQSQEGRMNAVVPQSEKMPPAVVGVHSFFILAQMETFEMSLNSAKDDLPLFTLAMSDSKVNQHTFEGDDDNSFLSFALGDFRIETPSFGSTLESYRTVLGVAPSTTSLLTVKYCKGAHAVSLCDVKDLDKSKCEACAEIALSPMRYVHIHSQVFTLKDYVTDGVFGVLAAKAASSAAAAAMEVAKSSQSGEQLFYVVASGFDIVLPQAAYSDKYFLFHTGKLEAHYRTLENNVGSESCMSMTDLMMYSGQQMNMFSSPVNMDFIVKMKSPFTIGTEDERATTVDMTTSRIRILLAKSDYAQMIHTLDCNISEQNNFLRIKKSQLSRSSSMGNENGNDSLVKSALVSATKDSSQVDKEDAETSQRMYINFNFQEISLDLCGTTTDDPILSLAALKALVVVKLLPDKKQTKASVTLHDLACDDRRAGSLDMSFRRMIGRTHANLSDANHIENSDVFSLDYTSNVGDSQDIKVNIGSYQIVVLPDVISDMVNFTKIPSHHGQLSTGDSSTDDSAMQVAVTNNASQEYEARLQTLDAGNASAQKKTSYHVQSSNVQFVFVDLGSSSATSSQTAKQSAITEVIVLQGKMKANFEMTSDELGEGVIENDYMLDAERVEIYTAKGAKLYHPVQILEPATFSIHCFQRLGDTVGAESTDFKFETLTPIDVTISMQNAALASTLVTSISDSFAGIDTVLEDNSEFHSLSMNETSRIAMLSSSLEYVDALDSPNQYPSEHPKDISIHDGDTLQKTKRVMKLRATLPSATLTLINDFQGMDEALFKLKTADCVLGGELDYASVSELEKPCFGCSMNTRQVERAMFQSILADYFDQGKNRWENLLTSPWEITFNGSRAPQSKFQSKRLLTTFDIESHPCRLSFSDHLLVSVGAASRMWSVYSGATKQAIALVDGGSTDDSCKRRLSRSMAAHAARSLIMTLPYAIENHSGISAFYSIGDDPARLQLPSNSTQFFQFELFPERGSGGMRRYGQDSKRAKSLTLYIGDAEISIHDMDSEANKSRSLHFISDYETHVFTAVVKSGNSTVLHISSYIEMYNSSSLPFRIAVVKEDRVHDLGVINPLQKKDFFKENMKKSDQLTTHSIFGLPAQLIRSFAHDTSKILQIQMSPTLDPDEGDLVGVLDLPPLEHLVEMANSDEESDLFEISCSPASHDSNLSSVVTNVRYKISLSDGSYPFVQLFIEPRAVITNKLPLNILLRTPMPHTFFAGKTSKLGNNDDPNCTTYTLNPLGSVEVFTPGPSIAVSMTCADLPIEGTPTGWIDGEWKMIPLGKNKNERIATPMKCIFPFQTTSQDSSNTSCHSNYSGRGSEFFILEDNDLMPDFDESSENQLSTVSESVRIVVFAVCNYAVDHSGNVLFEEVPEKQSGDTRSKARQAVFSRSLPAFSSTLRRRRVSLLPRSSALVRITHSTKDADQKTKRSVPFTMEDVPMFEGVDSMPILWDDNKSSGYFAYRHLTAEGSELHIIPEYVIFNGSQNHSMQIKQLSSTPFLLDPLKMACSTTITLDPSTTSPISRDKNNSIVVQFEIPDIDALTGPVQIDKVGLRVCVAKSKVTGEPLGSLAVQTVTGARDSCLVIKIGALNFSKTPLSESFASTGLFNDNFVRLRIQWSEVSVKLKDTDQGTEKYEGNRSAIRKYLEHHNVSSSEIEKKLAEERNDDGHHNNEESVSIPDVAEIVLHNLCLDFQRMWKDEDSQMIGADFSQNERSQFLIKIHNIKIVDCCTNNESITVFDSMSEKIFFDLCIRTRGPSNADLIRVDLIDLNLAYGDGKAEKIVVNTGEEFVWRVLDMTSRIMSATAELAGVDLDLKWDDDAGKFSVTISDPRIDGADEIDSDDHYEAPKSDTLFEVKQIRISPFILLVSFKRKPQSSRYKLIRGVRGARITNYFTTHLKFTIDRAELRFRGYMAKDMKGPPDRIADTIKAVYMAQLRTKVVTLLTATNFQDWKYLTGRESGGEEYIQGDFLRVFGNLAGNIGGAITGASKGGAESARNIVGDAGAGANNLLLGVGDGVGKTVLGASTGARDSLRDAGKGIGKAIGGIGNAADSITGRKMTGDGKTFVSEVGSSLASMGNSIGKGVEVTLKGPVEDGRRGLFGIGGLFRGGKSPNPKESSSK